MSEETPPSNPTEGSVPPVEPIVNEDLETLPVESTATEGTPVAAAATETTPAVEPEAPATTAPVATAVSSSHVMMPKWVVYGVVGIALAAIGFGVGWVAKPDSESSSRPAASGSPFANGNPFGENGPFSGNNGNGNGNSGGGSGNDGGIRASGAFLGVSAAPTSADVTGVEIAQVVAGSPADDAGFEAGDVITKVDDTEITSPAELVQVISAKDSGDKVTITYTRDDETKTADVTLGDRADAPTQLPDSRRGTED